jgi:hypothetical protein
MPAPSARWSNVRGLFAECDIRFRFQRLFRHHIGVIGKHLFTHVFQRVAGNTALRQQVTDGQTAQPGITMPGTCIG